MPPLTSIAHYKVTGKLGEGGMGCVYRATDTKLNREVAIKVITGPFASDPDRISRLGREAQMLASLNHPNIAAIYGMEDAAGSPALVIELVEGTTLAELIARGPVPLEEALAIARQICDALEAAHVKGIIHRDLKPANVKITPDGQVKVLDFGLAKALEGDDNAAAGSATMSPTLTLAATRAGVILGTAAYMSPEQARGVPADQRADIWAFGVVLYEMLTGRTTFAGETVADTLASVLKTDPDFALLPAQIPPAIRRLLSRCVERDRRRRLHHIADARLELDAPLEPAPPLPAAVPAIRARRKWLLWPIAAAIPLAAAFGWWLHRLPPAAVLPAKFVLAPPEGGEFSAAGHSVSPDGRHLIVRVGPPGRRGEYVLYLRDLNATGYRELRGTAQASRPVWSPDSKSIVFVQDQKWRRLEISGGSPVALCDAEPGSRGAAWNEQGVILIAPARGHIHRIPAGGGTPVPVTTLDPKSGETGHAFPSFLPGGRFFLYVSVAGGGGTVYVGDLEGKEQPQRLLQIDGSEAIFAADAGLQTGLLLFRRGDGMVGTRFDARRRAIVSDAIPILESISNPRQRNLPVSTSVPARLMLFNDDAVSTAREELALIDRAGKKIATVTPPGELLWGHLEFSPDGKRLLGSRYTSTGGGAVELWAVDLARGAVSRITFDGGSDKAQAWSPDGRRVVYMRFSIRGGGDDAGIWTTAADGTGKPERLLQVAGHHIGVSPDGRYVAFEERGTGRGIRLLDVQKPGKSEVLVEGPASFGWPQFSPDGRWLAYTSDETGRIEIYVQSFPPGRGKWQVSRDGGRLARWRADGKELMFLDGYGASRFYSVAVRQRGGSLEFDPPVHLFDISMGQRAGGTYFALSPDGQRIALNLPGPTAAGRPLTLMFDWMPGLAK